MIMRKVFVVLITLTVVACGSEDDPKPGLKTTYKGSYEFASTSEDIDLKFTITDDDRIEALKVDYKGLSFSQEEFDSIGFGTRWENKIQAIGFDRQVTTGKGAIYIRIDNVEAGTSTAFADFIQFTRENSRVDHFQNDVTFKFTPSTQ